jgi:hypothetical protein
MALLIIGPACLTLWTSVWDAGLPTESLESAILAQLYPFYPLFSPNTPKAVLKRSQAA